MIELENVSKNFKDKQVIKQVSLEIQNGKITTIVGENGAGKSTIIGLICGYYFLTSGKITGKQVSVMPDADNMPINMTGHNFLSFMCDLKGASMQQALELSAELGIEQALNKKIKTYSFGMKKKLSFIQGYVGESYDAYIFDEPTSGVDVPSAYTMMALIRKLKSSNQAVLLTSHNMDELERVGDYFYILKAGSIARQGTLKEVTELGLANRRYMIDVSVDMKDQLKHFMESAGIKIVSENESYIEIEIMNHMDISEIMKPLLNADITINGFWEERSHLANVAF